MLFRYSELCGMASDTVDAVRSTIAHLRLNCFDVRIPGTIDTVLYRLIGRTQVGIDLEGSFRFLQEVFGSLELILYSNLRNSQDAVDSRNIPFDMGHQIFSC